MLLWVLVVSLFILAFAGLVVPVLPDALLLMAGFVIYHLFINDQVLTPSFWWVASIITIVVIAIDYIASGLGASKYGASKWSFVTAAIGVVIFPFFIGPLGIIVGPFAMVLLTELLLKKSVGDAVKTGFGTLIGFLSGIFVKGVIMFGLVGWFFLKVIGN